MAKTLSGPRHFVVVGGGITGLAAALRLVDGRPAGVVRRITVLEASPRFGGKLAGGTVETGAGPRPVEFGADAFLARVPDALRLAERVGLGEDVIHPSSGQAYLFLGGELRPLPAETMLGVPSRPETLAESGVVTKEQAEAMAAEWDAPGEPLTDDRSVGSVVRERLGDAVVDNLMAPLLGGVYAGDVDQLSLQATIPALAARLREHPSLLRAVSELRRSPTTGPVFGSIRGGMNAFASGIVEALREASSDQSPVTLRTGAGVAALDRAAGAWQLTLVGGERLSADAVIVTTPADVTARLLAPQLPEAAAALAEIPYADVALINLVLPRGEFPAGSGVLVPTGAGLAIKAVTFVDQKWGSVDPNARLLRVSVGRYGDSSWQSRCDEELVSTAVADLSAMFGSVAAPAGAVVHRWRGGLPQYLVGHLDRIRLARESLAGSGIAIAGAGYDGVGIPACIGSGNRAADEVAAFATVDSSTAASHTRESHDGAGR